MEWGFFPHLADLLAERGFTAVRFNFTGSGMKPGDDLVTDLAAFRGATFSQDRDVVPSILVDPGTAIAPGRVDSQRIGIFGHSRGGGAALLASAHPDWRDGIGALVTWSAVGTFDRLDDRQKLVWRQMGKTEVTNARTGQVLEIDRLVLDDLIANREALDLYAAAQTRVAPWLLIHGGDDETVPVAEGRQLAECAGGEGSLIEIAGAGHTLGAGHPFVGPTPELITALNATQTWGRDHLVNP